MNRSEIILNYTKEHVSEYFKALKEAVCLETPTEGLREDLDACRNYFAGLFKSEGFVVNEVRNYDPRFANHLLAEFGKNAGSAAERLREWQSENKELLKSIYEGTASPALLPGKAHDEGPGEYILFGGHYDTVHKKGSFVPVWTETDKTVSGPGVLDMKGGDTLVWYIIKTLKTTGLFPKDAHVVFFMSGDEETGSSGSSEYYKELARHASACFIMEPSTGVLGVDADYIGGLKSGRYGRGCYTFHAKGTPYHSGINPTFADSALIELAMQAVRLERLTVFDKPNPKSGASETVTVGCTCISSGNSGWSTIPGEGELTIDARFSSAELAEKYDKLFKNITSYNPSVCITTSGSIEKPPFDKDEPGNRRLQKIAEAIGQELGVEIKHGVVGSGSDGNFTSSVGCPTLDGLGATGNHIHQLGEYINKDHIPFRAALTAEMLLRITEEK